MKLDLSLRAAVTAALGLACLAPAGAHAAGTAAGTAIVNTAQVTYTLGGTTANATSNTVTLRVAELLDASVTPLVPVQNVRSGDTGRVVPFRVTSVGNGPEAWRLELDAARPGDQFDPTPQAPALYLDTDNSGDLTPADLAYVPGTNDPLLQPDASVLVFAVLDVPTGLADGDRGTVLVRATALTGSGAPGTVFPGLGEGGGDAVAGASGARPSGTADLLVAGFDIAVVKSVTVDDGAGGAQPLPGAQLTYELRVTVTGPGTAPALVLTDAVPTSTTFVPGSLLLDGGALTDATDADAGELAAGPIVTVRLGDVAGGSPVKVVRFTVRID
jgi:uncharacterized repeat protein (TIGR01451 family)